MKRAGMNPTFKSVKASFNRAKSLFRKQNVFPILSIFFLLLGLVVAINVSRENQSRISRAEVIATTPSSYGYGDYGSNVYNETVTATPTPAGTLPTNTPTPPPTNTPPTPTPTNTPGAISTPTDTPIPTPTPNTTNLALNKPITAGSTFLGFPASKAVDGSTGTSWSSGSDSNSRWIDVDLGTSYPVSKFVIKHRDKPYTTKDFSILVSSDNANWTTVVSVSNNANRITTHAITPSSARYVKLNVIIPAKNAYPYAVISEFEVY